MKLLLPGIALSIAPMAVGAQVVESGKVEAQPAPAAFFTGKVSLKRLTSAVAPGQAGTALVMFEKGARSHWHVHPAGQTLYVTEGCGWTQEEGGRVHRICAGDVVYVAPGVRHWHGASSDSAMTHLAISEVLNGGNVDWAEAVDDDQYRGPSF